MRWTVASRQHTAIRFLLDSLGRRRENRGVDVSGTGLCCQTGDFNSHCAACCLRPPVRVSVLPRWPILASSVVALPVAKITWWSLPPAILFTLTLWCFFSLRRSVVDVSRDDPESPQTVAECANDVEASLAVATLAKQGIRATAVGGFTSGFQAEAPGIVRVVVPRSQFARATAALTAIRGEADDVDRSLADEVTS